MKQRLLALLVGVDQYHKDSLRVTNLSGCVNDVLAAQQMLKKYYRHLKPNIRMLTNEKATYANVIRHFQDHLIAQANQNTTILFWFSGHGSRQPTDPVFHQYLPQKRPEDLKDETLVCHDSRVVDQNKQYLSHDLADKELAVLIDQAAQKEAEVITIFDCCHSGSITRETEEEVAKQRLSEEKSSENRVRYNYLNGHYQKHGLTTVPEGTHIALSACQKNETAKELNIQGQRRGVFSYHLQQVLSENPGLTYVQLFERTCQAVGQYKFQSSQTPQFEPINDFDAHQAFLIPQRPPAFKQRYAVTYHEIEKRWKINLGATQGIPQSGKPVRFAIYAAANDSETSLTKAQATSVEMLHSGLALTHPQSLVPGQTYWGEWLSLPEVPLVVGLEGNAKVGRILQETKQQYGASHFTLRTHVPAFCRVILTRTTWQLVLGDTHLPEEKLDYLVLVAKLEQIGRYQTLLRNQNPRTQLNIADFAFTIESQNKAQKVTSSSVFQLHTFKVPSLKSPLLCDIKAQNPTSQDLFFTLLYFSPGYGIKVLHNQPVDVGGKLHTLTGGRLRISPQHLEKDRFQLIVSTQKLQDHFYNQPDLFKEEHRDFEQYPTHIPNDWCTITLELEVKA